MNYMSSNHTRHLADIILGGQDGLVDVLGLSIGMVGATGDIHLVLISGLAAAFSEAISMGAVVYTSTQAALDYEQKEAHHARIGRLDLEHALSHLSCLPPAHQSFIRSKLLGDAGSVFERPTPLAKALKVGLATLFGAVPVLMPYLLLPLPEALFLSIALSALVLFSTGALKAHWTVGSWKRSGLEMLLVGGLAAIAGYGIGMLLRAPVI